MSGEEKPVDDYTSRVRTDLTPVVKIGGSTTGITYTSRSGSKVVSQDGICNFWMKIQLLDIAALTGAVTIEGLLDDVEDDTVAEIHIAASSKVSCTKALIATAAEGGKVIALGDRLLDGTDTVAIDEGNIADDSYIELTGRYFVAV